MLNESWKDDPHGVDADHGQESYGVGLEVFGAKAEGERRHGGENPERSRTALYWGEEERRRAEGGEPGEACVPGERLFSNAAPVEEYLILQDGRTPTPPPRGC